MKSQYKKVDTTRNIVLPVLIVVLSAFFLSSCRLQKEDSSAWVGTWAAAQQLIEPSNMPPAPGLSNNTIRQIVCVSIGGDRIRVNFSNEYSTAPVTLREAHIALSTGGGAIEPSSDTVMRFGGKTDVTIDPGSTATSDPLFFPLRPRSDVAITIHFGDTSPDITGHPGSRTTSYIQPGNEVCAADLSFAVKTDHWYIIDSIDMIAQKDTKAVVILGDSITDGRGSGTNRQNRWPDELTKRLHEDPKTRNIAVLNMGIGGNCVLRDCLGAAAVNRYERDVLGINRVSWLIIFEGINDIGEAETEEDAAMTAINLIAAYDRMISLAHEKGILVYGATLMPFCGAFYYEKFRESARQTVNDWIRNSRRFDAVVDLDRVMADPANPGQMLPDFDTGDHLHPNEAGHRNIAKAFDIKLFYKEKL